MNRWFRVAPLLTVLLVGCMEGNKGNLHTRKAPLYERVGGEKMIRNLVDDFVTNATSDPGLSDPQREYFKRDDDRRFKDDFVRKIAQDTGGPQKYTGKNLKSALPNLAIKEVHFKALLEDWKRALTRCKIADDEKNELIKLFESWRNDFVQLES